MMISNTIRRPIPGFDWYLACDDGTIYSTKTNRTLKMNIQSSGRYYIVNIKSDEKGKFNTERVHRLVCTAFHGPPPTPKHTVSHIDGNWRNNTPSNLRWETLKENHQMKKKHGTDDRGVRNSRARIDASTLAEIRRLLKEGKMTHEKIGLKFGLSRVFITKIRCGIRYPE